MAGQTKESKHNNSSIKQRFTQLHIIRKFIAEELKCAEQQKLLTLFLSEKIKLKPSFTGIGISIYSVIPAVFLKTNLTIKLERI